MFLNGHKTSKLGFRIRYSGLRIRGHKTSHVGSGSLIRITNPRIWDPKEIFPVPHHMFEKNNWVSAARLSLSVLSWLSPLAHEEALDRLSPSNSSSKFGSGSPPSSGDSLWRCERPWNYHFSIPETQNFMNLWPNNSWKILFEFFSSLKQISSFVKVCIFYKQLSHDSFVKM